MSDARLRHCIAQVHAGQLPRREFLQNMAALGLTPAMAAALLGGPTQAQAQTPGSSTAPFVYRPTRR